MNDWRETTLGDEIELAYGKSLPAHTRQPGRFGVFGSNGIVGTHVQACVEGPGIVVGRKGSVGEITYCSDAFWPIDTTYYVVNKGKHNWRFLYHLLCHYDLTGLNSHSAVPGLNRDDAYSIAVMLPQRGEQDDIASVLDCLENSIHLETDALANAQELKRAAMGKLFTRGLRGEPQKETEIGLVPESWEIATIGDVATSTQYGLSLRGQPEGTCPILRMNCQEDGRVHYRNLQFVDLDPGTLESFRVRPGDLLFNRTNSIDLVGRIAIVEDDRPAVFASYLVRLTVDERRCEPKFLNYFMNWPETQREIKKLASRAVGQANINASKLRTVQFWLPSLTEQREIVAILDAIDRKIDLHRKKRAVLEELFKAVLHKLMTGEIRVADLDLSALADAPARHEDVVA